MGFHHRKQRSLCMGRGHLNRQRWLRFLPSQKTGPHCAETPIVGKLKSRRVELADMTCSISLFSGHYQQPFFFFFFLTEVVCRRHLFLCEDGQ